ncbi:type III-A CRISPR-associated protein Cas10/Csm1 [Pectobacterium sp. LFLA-215]|uniref:type III-A CRISPR-associated protein Cas10/Csm1 n=1 Tax=Pectobacterium sp. LFLA-215 TaxID=3419008 RepID=UPI003F5B9570
MNWLAASCHVAAFALLHNLKSLALHAGIQDFPSPALAEKLFAPLPKSLSDCADLHEDTLTPLLNFAARLACGDQGIPTNNDKTNLIPLTHLLVDDPHAVPAVHCYSPLAPLGVDSLMPVTTSLSTDERQAAYQQVYQTLIDGLDNIPAAHRLQPSLWLDHLDSLWMTACHALPDGDGASGISRYDQGKTTAALAVALWQHHARQARPEQDMPLTPGDDARLLLIQADVFGIQELIFAQGNQTQKMAAKLLRGRSFQVSLLAETAALRVLEAFDLPPICQLINAAGKSLIVAPNLPDAAERLAELRQCLDEWFLTHTYAQTGIGLCSTVAGSAEFLGEQAYGTLQNRLAQAMEQQKYQRFSLCAGDAPPPVFDGYLDHIAQGKGGEPCPVNGLHPVETTLNELNCSRLAADQITLGHWISRGERYARLLILRDSTATFPDNRCLHLTLFGYQVVAVSPQEASGKFGELARNGSLRRCWDVSLPPEGVPLFQGYARRFINGWMPLAQGEYQPERYPGLEEELDDGDIKTFDHLSYEDLYQDADHALRGTCALGVLKGDIDNLGHLFRSGLPQPSFAKTIGLSRQIHLFFTLWLPHLCRKDPRFANTYTVFAGGDDFFLIGPWRSQQTLALTMAQHFAQYSGHNPALHFSLGLVQVKPSYPVRALAAQAEAALEQAKQHPGKNAICLYNQAMGWPEYGELLACSEELARWREQEGYPLSSGLLYRLLALSELSSKESDTPQAALWRSRLAYFLRRNLVDKVKVPVKENPAAFRHQLHLALFATLEQHLKRHRQRYRVALQRHLYHYRTANKTHNNKDTA